MIVKRILARLAMVKNLDVATPALPPEQALAVDVNDARLALLCDSILEIECPVETAAERDEDPDLHRRRRALLEDFVSRHREIPTSSEVDEFAAELAKLVAGQSAALAA